jgi:hypothetical protein
MFVKVYGSKEFKWVEKSNKKKFEKRKKDLKKKIIKSSADWIME